MRKHSDKLHKQPWTVNILSSVLLVFHTGGKRSSCRQVVYVQLTQSQLFVRKSTKHALSQESITKSHTKLNKWPFLKTIDKTLKNWRRKKGQLAIYWLGLWIETDYFSPKGKEPSTFIWLSALWQNEFVKWLTNTYTGWDNFVGTFGKERKFCT